MKVLAFQLFILTFGFQSFWVLSFFSPPEWYNDALQVSVIFDTYWERLNYCCDPSLVSADCHKSLPAKVLLLRKLQRDPEFHVTLHRARFGRRLMYQLF